MNKHCVQRATGAHWADSVKPMRNTHPRVRQRGFGSVEYMLITAALVAALLTPFSFGGGAPKNVIQHLLDAIQDQHQAYLYAASMPVRPHPEGWSGGGNNSNTGGVFDDGPDDQADNSDSGDTSNSDADSGADGDTADLPDDANAGGEPGGGSGHGSGNDSGGNSSNDADGDSNNGAPNDAGGPSGEEGGSADNGDDSPGDSGSSDSGGGDSDIDWFKWAAGVAAELYCLVTPPEIVPWTEDDIVAYKASWAVYGDKIKYEKEGNFASAGEGFAAVGVKYNPPKDFSAALTQQNGQWILAFRGTEPSSPEDWFEDIDQAVTGESPQYNYAAELAQAVDRKVEGDILFVGHSLGGGLASAAAYATGGRAITFNAAGLNSHYITDESVNIRAHYVAGEILTLMQEHSPLPDAAGQQIVHSADCSLGPGRRHSITTFKASLERWLEYQRNNKQRMSGSGGPSADRATMAAASPSAVRYNLDSFVPPAQRAPQGNVHATP